MSMMRGGNMSMLRRMATDPEVTQHRLTRGVVRRILAFAKPYRGLIIVFIGLVVVSSALAVAPPLLFQADHRRGSAEAEPATGDRSRQSRWLCWPCSRR